jgi:FeS assembly SUF system regulator
MLRVSKMADYGTVIMTAIARDPDHVHSATSLAATTGVAAPTVCKLLKMLSHGGLVVSLRGANGGYLLPRPPERITLADVIAAVDGPLGMTECSTAPGLCLQEAECAIRANWQKISMVIYDALRQITLADMARPALFAVDISAIRARALPDSRTSAGSGPRGPRGAPNGAQT